MLAGAALRRWAEPQGSVPPTAETLQLVRRCVDRLPAAHRAVLLLCDVEALSLGEVADLLGVGTEVAKARLHQARQALCSLLDASMGGPGERRHEAPLPEPCPA
jgi:DNA-directed RNA polymerase specialized sigma24 family protein